MNLGQLRTALQARGYATDTATQQTELINAVYREVSGYRRWDWLQAAGGSTTVVGQDTVSTGGITNLVSIDTVRVLFGTSYYDLEYLTPTEFDTRAYVDRDVGTPQYWTYQKGDLYLWPRPDKVYQVDINYIKDPPDLTADADTPLFPATYHDLLVWGALRDIAHRERDWAASDHANARFETLLARMTAAHGMKQRQAPRQVRRSDFWSTVGS